MTGERIYKIELSDWITRGPGLIANPGPLNYKYGVKIANDPPIIQKIDFKITNRAAYVAI